MFTASLYIILCSARNRLRVRLRRLREPRYLIGAFVGAAYIYFSFFARFRMSSATGQRRRAGRAGPPILMLSAVRSAAPGVAGPGPPAVTPRGWLFPFGSGSPGFSEAETPFLSPA